MADLNQVVEKYIELRDRKAALKREYEDKVKDIDTALEKAEIYLLQQMQTLGMEAIPTKAGTAYRSTKTSAQVADWDAVLGFVKETNNWAMLERRVAKAAVVQYREEHDDLPPGINWREETSVNVRRG